MTNFPDRDPQLMYEMATSRLSLQLEFIDAIDGKIALLVSLASAILGIAAATFALHATAAVSQPTSGAHFIGGSSSAGLSAADLATLAVGVAIYGGIVWFGMRAYRCRNWMPGATLRAVMRQHRGPDSDRTIKWGVAVDTWRDFEDNLPAYNTKEKALQLILFGTALETLALVTAISLVAAGA